MGNNKFKVLVVEDDRSISSLLETILQTGGYQVFCAYSCRTAVMMFSSCFPDVILLDLGLPDGDGCDLIRQIRLQSSVPIIVVSSRWNVPDKVTALDMGANDYVTKPFSNGELMARIRAALRSSRPGTLPGKVFSLGDLAIDYDKRQVTIAGNVVHLTQTEYNILAYLSQHSGKVLTYAAIIRHTWGSLDEGSTKKLQVNMVNIRKKLGSHPGESRYIINELGVGSRMKTEESPS